MIIKQRPKAGAIERMDLVGSVDDSDVIIVDDMIDTAGTLCAAAEQLKAHGGTCLCWASLSKVTDPSRSESTVV